MLGAYRVEDIGAEVALRGVALDCEQMPKRRDGYNERRLHQVTSSFHPSQPVLISTTRVQQN